jgi:polysaccharide biosynthesis protein PslH
MESLLFLAHRLPYPPNKGDKVRSYHFLRHLAERYRVFLGTFIDDPVDWQHLDAVRSFCADVRVERLAPRSKRVTSVTGLLTGEALSLPYFRSRALHAWVEDVARREGIRRAFAYSSPMAQYILDLPKMRRIVDFVDVDSAKWREYAQRRRWPVSTIYQREASRLLAYEREVAARADASLFVTDEEAELFRRESGDRSGRIVAIHNGVDSDHFSPSAELASPFAPDERAVVFTGAMDYWPNIDAVVWFAREVLPEIRRRDPAVRFYVVGMNPDASVRALASNEVAVTGRVADVRPYLRHASVVVAPLRVARGIQNKVLEAMAMAKAVVATPAAARGLRVQAGTELEVAPDEKEFIAKVLGLMEPTRAEGMGRLARSRVLDDYTWAAGLKQLDELIERGTAVPSSPRPAVPAGARLPAAAR